MTVKGGDVSQSRFFGPCHVPEQSEWYMAVPSIRSYTIDYRLKEELHLGVEEIVVVAVFAVIVAFEYLTADSKVSIGPDVPYKFRIDEKARSFKII